MHFAARGGELVAVLVVVGWAVPTMFLGKRYIEFGGRSPPYES